jgi:hypothetical protein
MSNWCAACNRLCSLCRFRSPCKLLVQEWRAIVQRFQQHQDYEKAYRLLTSSSYVTSILGSKTKQQMTAFKEHVSQILGHFFILLMLMGFFSSGNLFQSELDLCWVCCISDWLVELWCNTIEFENIGISLITP